MRHLLSLPAVSAKVHDDIDQAYGNHTVRSMSNGRKEEPLDQDLRRRLIDVAKLRGTISYSDLRPEAPQTLAAPLDEINTYEHRKGDHFSLQ